MRTNDLFRDYLEDPRPARPRIRPGFYYLPAGSFDPAAPTMADLAEAVEITGLSFDELAETMRRVGDAAREARAAILDYTKPTPTPPWAGNIATQKRRKRL